MFDLNEIRRKVPIARLLSDGGYAPVRSNGRYSIYRSPFHSDTHPSFSVNIEKNRWHDFTLGLDGSNIDLVMMLGLAGSCGEAARYLAAHYLLDSRYVCGPPGVRDGTADGSTEEKGEIISVTGLACPRLIDYLTRARGIPLSLAGEYLKEVHYRLPSGREIYGAGMSNIAGGYALRNPYFKMAIPPVGVSLIPGGDGSGCLVSEGMLSYLSVVALHGRPECDSVILNSVTNVRSSAALLSRYERILCYLDNDAAGTAALARIRASCRDSTVSDGSGLYEGYNDANDYLTSKIKHQK